MFPNLYKYDVKCGPDSSNWITIDNGITNIYYVQPGNADPMRLTDWTFQPWIETLGYENSDCILTEYYAGSSN